MLQSPPSLFQIDQLWTVTVSDKFYDYNNWTSIDPFHWDLFLWWVELSKKRWIEYTWEEALRVVFWLELTATREELLQKVNHAFWSTKDKFQLIDRDMWWRYFDHQIAVAKLYLEYAKNPSILWFITALQHDSKEDTDISFWTLKDTFNVEVALCVQHVSKPPFKDFIDSEDTTVKGLSESEKYTIDNWRKFKKFNPFEISEIKRIIWEKSDHELFEYITNAWYPNSWILNSKWLLSDDYLYRVKYYERLKNGEEDDLWDDTPIEISHDERIAEWVYRILSARYNRQKNEAFFFHMVRSKEIESDEHFDDEFPNFPCINTFYNNARKFKSEYNRTKDDKNKHIRLSKERLIKWVFISLEVKFIDRIHNLKTEVAYSNYSPENIKKARRKIDETKMYFYEIAREFDKIKWTKYFDLIKFEVEKLEKYIDEEDDSQRFRLVCEWYKRTTKGVLDWDNIWWVETFKHWKERQ